MAENKYSVELISGLAPKNNGSFPIVHAKDVEMPDGTRLSDFKGGNTNETAVMPDWSVNDPNTPGYIRNRTHWEKVFPVIEWNDHTDGKEFFDASAADLGIFYKISDEILDEDALKTASVVIGSPEGDFLHIPYHSILLQDDTVGLAVAYADETGENLIFLCSAYAAADLTEEFGFVIPGAGLYMFSEFLNTDRTFSLEIPPVIHKIKKEFLPDDIALPKVTTDDNDKIMQVINGVWTKITLADSVVKTYIDDYISSALGGDY